FRAERRLVRELVEKEEFVEVFVDTPLEICIERDPKGLYKKARAGKVFHVTGIDSPYEPPENADIRLRSNGNGSADALAEEVIAELARRRSFGCGCAGSSFPGRLAKQAEPGPSGSV